ncbi:MAG: hypothetical protein WCF36_14930 [Candidatus Nanopelagicales bacterium]
MKATELDQRFDAGADISEVVDWDSARRINHEPRRVNVDFPAWMIASMDQEADRLGISRQALIKVWIAERLERKAG